MTEELVTPAHDPVSEETRFAPPADDTETTDNQGLAVGKPSRQSLPHYPLGFWGWVQVRLLGQNVREARERQLTQLTQEIERHPDAPSNYVLRGELYRSVGLFDLAKEDFTTGLALATVDYTEREWGILAQSLADRARYGLQDVERCRRVQ